MIESNNLDVILQKQRQLNDWIDFPNLSEEDRHKYLDLFSGGIVEEAVEFRRCIKHRKFWKKYDSPDNVPGMYEEFADMLAYLANIALVLNIGSEQIMEIFYDKYEVNTKRKKQGY